MCRRATAGATCCRRARGRRRLLGGGGGGGGFGLHKPSRSLQQFPNDAEEADSGKGSAAAAMAAAAAGETTPLLGGTGGGGGGGAGAGGKQAQQASNLSRRTGAALRCVGRGSLKVAAVALPRQSAELWLNPNPQNPDSCRLKVAGAGGGADHTAGAPLGEEQLGTSRSGETDFSDGAQALNPNPIFPGRFSARLPRSVRMLARARSKTLHPPLAAFQRRGRCLFCFAWWARRRLPLAADGRRGRQGRGAGRRRGEGATNGTHGIAEGTGRGLRSRGSRDLRCSIRWCHASPRCRRARRPRRRSPAGATCRRRPARFRRARRAT